MQELVEIGKIIKPHGIKGAVKVFIHTIFRNALRTNRGAFFIEARPIPLPFFIENFFYEKGERNNNIVVITFEEVDTREAAEQLRGKKLLIEKENIRQSVKPNLYNEVIGFTVTDAKTKEQIGKVEDILEMPMQTIAQLQYKNQEVFLPLNKQTVKKIEITKKNILVNIPSGLLEVYSI